MTNNPQGECQNAKLNNRMFSPRFANSTQLNSTSIYGRR